MALWQSGGTRVIGRLALVVLPHVFHQYGRERSQGLRAYFDLNSRWLPPLDLGQLASIGVFVPSVERLSVDFETVIIGLALSSVKMADTQ